MVIKKIQRNIAIFFCIMLCFSLTACGSEGGTFTKQDRESQITETEFPYKSTEELTDNTTTVDISVNSETTQNTTKKKSLAKKETSADDTQTKKETTKQDKSANSTTQNKSTTDFNTKNAISNKKQNTQTIKKQQKTTSKKTQSTKTQTDTSDKHSSSNVSNSSVSTTQTQEVGERYVTRSDGSDTKQDKFQTSPVPQGQQKPVEPQDVTVDKKVSATCSIEVNCATIKNNMDKLTKSKISLVPENGIIYKNDSAVFYEGESVSDVLKRELKENKIHFEFTSTPGFNTDYIEGIGNLYEFDCGELSGWTYCVNGWFPNYGCSRYVVTQGDKIIWYYTCDLGKDVGGNVQSSTSTSTTK